MTEKSRESADQNVRLAEFSALRAEITHRLATQQALIALNLTAVATIAGFALTHRSSQRLLLLNPAISSTLGLLWLHQGRGIGLLGRYIREQLWIWHPSWDEWRMRVQSSDWLGVVVYTLPVAAVYIASAVVPLVVAWPGSPDTATVTLLGLDIASTALLIYAWAEMLAAIVRQRAGVSAPSG